MRIALFTDTFTPQVNGVTMTLNHLIEYWKSKGVDFLVFAPDDEESLKLPNIHRVPSYPFPLYTQWRFPLSSYGTIEKETLKFNPDLIHLVTPCTLGWFGLRYGLRHDIPLVASFHTNFDQYLDYYHVPFLKKALWSYLIWFHGHCERNYCPSLTTKKVLEEHGIPNVEIWSRGIDTSNYSPELRNSAVHEKYGIDPSKLLLLYVGRLAPEKDIDILLSSYRILPQDVKNQVHLILVGDGPLMGKLNAIEYPDITCTGFLRGRELSEMYASCDLFVFPSSTETFGNVVLEAMASGLPVVGVKAGGVKELIAHMKNGVLCEPRSVESFLEGINIMVRHNQLRMQMAHHARLYALERDWKSIFDMLMESYHTVAYAKDADKKSAVL